MIADGGKLTAAAACVAPETPGDVIEFGVFEGDSAKHLAKLFPTRRVWALDTYKGIPASLFRAEHGDHDEPGKFTPRVGPMEMFEGWPQIVPLEGLFTDTLKQIPPDIMICFAHCDCDLYLSYKSILPWLWRRLSPGGVISVDDYSMCKGCRRAIDEFCDESSAVFDPERKVLSLTA